MSEVVSHGPWAPLPTPQVARRGAAGGWRLAHPRAWFMVPAIALLVAAWVVLAPLQLGGSTSYAIASGTSMLPNFHAGDLVLLRQQPTYTVGEVAGYRNDQLGVTVMHRIMAVNGDRYAFKGDNNSWIDLYEPTANQIVGVEWVHLSGLGNVLMTLRAPVVTAFVVGLLWLFAVWPRSTSRRQRRRRRHVH